MADDRMPAKPKKKRRVLWWKRPTYWVLLLLLAFVVFRFVVHQRVANRLNAIRNAGYPVTLEELDAWYPYPQGPNAADVYQQAFDAYVTDLCFEETLPVLGKYLDSPKLGEKMPDDVVERVTYYLEQNARAIALLEQAGKIEGARHPADMTEGAGLLLPHLGQLRHGARLLKLKSAMHTQNGEIDSAAASAMSIFPLADSLKNEPIILSSLVQTSLEFMAYHEFAHLIDTGDIDGDVLEALSLRISAYDAQRMHLRSIVGQRCFDNDHFFNTGPFIDVSDDPVAAVVIKVWRAAGVIALDHAYYLTQMQTPVGVAESGDWPPPTSGSISIDPPLIYPISNIVCDNFSAANLLSHKMNAKQMVMLTLIGTEQYRQEHGQWPERLDELASGHLKHIPIDPFTNKPLKYRREADGIIIYSIGSDGEDNGGLPYDQYGSLGQGSDGTDITATLNITTETLWPTIEKEPETFRGGSYGDSPQGPDGYGGHDGYSGYGSPWFDDVDSEKALEAYLNMLNTKGFPALSPRLNKHKWSSIDDWFANDPEAENYTPDP